MGPECAVDTSLGFWSAANRAITNKERREFERWRENLWLIADGIRAEARRPGVSPAFTSKAEELMQSINQIPELRQ